MSRILRRPMFRGGRVDARGTGIASGLGYNNGGRVGFDNGGLSLEQQKNLANYQSNRRSNKKFTYDSIRDRMQAYYDNLYLRGMNEGDIDMGLQISPNMSPDDIAEANYYEQTPKKFEEDFFSGIIGGTNYDDIMKNLSSGAKLAGEENLYVKPSEEIVSSESEENGSNKLTEGGGLPEKTKAEKLEEYQKMFEEAYGTGRGEDISNMLLSFAGKALKPEATVKSSFGEFFEEEAKRPSESKKYKDASTTAAINAFLTGEKSVQELEKLMATTKYGIDYRLLAGAKDFDENLTEIKKSESNDLKAIERAIAKTYSTDKNKIFPKRIKDTEDVEFTKENINEIYIDETTKYVYLITLGETGEIVPKRIH